MMQQQTRSTSRTMGLVVAAMFGGWLATVTPCAGGESYWANSAGGSFQTAGNWLPSGVPGAADNARFTNNATYTVAWAASVTNANAYFDAPGGTAAMNIGAGRSWTLNQLFATNTANGLGLYSGTLILENGGALTRSADYTVGGLGATYAPFTWRMAGGTFTKTGAGKTILGGTWDGNNTAHLIVTGSGTVFTNGGGVLQVGNSYNTGGSSLLVTNGGTVYAGSLEVRVVGVAGHPGNTLTVDGANSTVYATTFSLGQGSHDDKVTITNGGRVVVSGAGAIGADSGFRNTLVVSGTNSGYFGNSYFYLYGKSNTFLVSNGGTFSNGLNWLSLTADASANSNNLVISGAGSRAIGSQNLSINQGSDNQLAIRAGGLLQMSGQADIRSSGNRLLVTDTNSFFTTGGGVNQDLMVQSGLTPGLIVSNGASVVGYFGRLSAFGAATGTVVVTGSGSVWTNLSDLRLGEAANSRGDVTIADGGRVRAATTTVASGANSRGNLAITGANSELNCSALTVANSAGQVGVVSFVAGTGGVGIANVSGALTLGAGSSTLNVDVSNYVPTANPITLTLVDYGSKVGNFSATNLVGRSGWNMALDPNAPGTKITLTIEQVGTAVLIR